MRDDRRVTEGARFATARHRTEGMLIQDWQMGGFGIYVHWPFCQAKCPYCDFNSHVARDVDHERWRAAFVAEIGRVAQQLGPRVVNSVYFGGGTPSLMPPKLVGSVIEAVAAAFPLANDIEITLEANPSSVEADRFRGYRSAGVNRVSLGVQALNDPDLRRLGRLHSAGEAVSAVELAQVVFDRVSFDLIYARQHQELKTWRRELRDALALGAEHLSLYQLTVEPGTAFSARLVAGGLRGLPDEDLAAEFYEETQAICESAGMPAYEVSNHAADGNEARHNLIYWRYGDYAGIGPGAHGRITLGAERFATQAPRSPEAWLERVGESGSGFEEITRLTPQDQADEYLMMALRLSEGADLPRYAALAGAPLEAEGIARLSQLGLVRVAGERIQTTSKGRLVLNAVIAELLSQAGQEVT